MNTQTSTKTLAVLLSVALIASIFSGAGTPAVKAQTSSASKVKISSDLKQKLSGTSKLNVIIRSAGPWSSTLTNAVTGNGGTVSRSYTNFNLKMVNLPPAAVTNLASRSDVDYVTLDRSVKKLGHVSLTSGTDAAGVMGGTTPYDGSGIGIAVLDSGVNSSHVDFKDAAGLTRVIKSVDFTGENRTDDPYGHGTHVASLAAGNALVAQGAYAGIAPGAKIVNLRVLNSQGAGTISSLLTALDWVKTNRVTYNIRVVNMSLGTAAVDSYKFDPLCLAVRSLVDSGIVVVAAAGNEGRDSSGNKVYGQIHSLSLIHI